MTTFVYKWVIRRGQRNNDEIFANPEIEHEMAKDYRLLSEWDTGECDK